MIFTLLGILSSVIFILGDIPYFLDTLHGKTKPHRVTWGVVFLLNCIGFANQYASGASDSLWLFGAAVVATGAIFFASIKNGTGGSSKFDIVALVLSLFGILLWIVLKDPVVSIAANLIVALISVVPTIRKAKNDPSSETRSAYLFGGISSLLGTIAVGELKYELLILPFAGFAIQAYIVYLLYLKRSAN